MALVYSTGTVSVTNGSPTVTLSGGSWLENQILPGSQIRIAGEPATIIMAWTDTSTIEVAVPIERATGSGLTYAIVLTSAEYGTNIAVHTSVQALLTALRNPLGLLSDSADPTSGDGSDGQSWLNTSSGDLFYKDNGSWSLLLNIKGPAGSTGDPAGVEYTYDTTTADADPGSGKARFNNATLGSVTAAYVDNLDAGGADVTTWLDTFDDSDATSKGFLFVRSQTSTFLRIYSITGSVVNGTGYRKLTLTHLAGQGTISNGDAIFLQCYPSGSKGDAGAAGMQPGVTLTFDSATTDDVPAAGKIRFNNATLASVTNLYINDADADANNIEDLIGTLDDATGTTKGRITFKEVGDETHQARFAVTGSVIDGTGYWKVPVSFEGPSGAANFADADGVVLVREMIGDKGESGDTAIAGTQAEVTTTKTITLADKGILQRFTGSADTTFTFTDAATLGEIGVPGLNGSSYVLTLEADAADTINDAASIDLQPGQGFVVFSNGVDRLDALIFPAPAAGGLAAPSFVAPHLNLAVTSSDNVTVDISADELELVHVTTGERLILTSVAETANITVSGENGLDSGSEATSTHYYTYIAAKFDGSDPIAILSVEAAYADVTLPTGYTHLARVGVCYNNSAGNIRAFTQYGRECAWYDPHTADASGSVGTGSALVTISVPPVFGVVAHISVQTSSANSDGVVVMSAIVPNVSISNNYMANILDTYQSSNIRQSKSIMCSDSRQVRVDASAASQNYAIFTYGYTLP
ncbi:MAG: hypothetical protein H6873_05675 [Hyphomicrobiaceae bacterium]|nr:hypothetical protein [Hyphomicrobiaceae bacterium]